jgi:hypothetical protein
MDGSVNKIVTVFARGPASEKVSTDLKPGSAQLHGIKFLYREKLTAPIPGNFTRAHLLKFCTLTHFLHSASLYPDRASCHSKSFIKCKSRNRNFYQRTRKSFAAYPSNLPFAAKHMLFDPDGLPSLNDLTKNIDGQSLFSLCHIKLV